MTFNQQLESVKSAGEDFEWYPTTDEIIRRVHDWITNWHEETSRYRYGEKIDFLDIGAGNGKVLAAMADIGFLNNRYAIEKSLKLISYLPKEIMILGTDFLASTLIDKQVKFIFCNPPYSEYAAWTEKILTEAVGGSYIFLVVPSRWKDSDKLKSIIKERKIEHEVLDSFDFQHAEDRRARAKVDLILFHISENAKSSFEHFFENNFKFPEPKPRPEFEKEFQNTSLVHKSNMVETLCLIYQRRMGELNENYTKICSLDFELLKELGISKQQLAGSLLEKITGLKREFWVRLFECTGEIKRRLTHKSRRSMEELLNSQTGIDFTRDNAYAVILWVIKNANDYFDQQLIETYEKLICLANIENYKSNQRVFEKWQFRYDYYNQDVRDTVTHFRVKVGHRIVLKHSGGLTKSDWSYNRGLDERAAQFIGDMLTIANNLGFTTNEEAPEKQAWEDNGARVYSFTRGGKTECLFKVRAFFNSNLHFQFHPAFVHALNIHYGKLRGWLYNKEDAAYELALPDLEESKEQFGFNKSVVDEFFDSHFRIQKEQLKLI